MVWTKSFETSTALCPKLVELGEGEVVVGRIFQFDVELQIVHKAGFGEIARTGDDAAFVMWPSTKRHDVELGAPMAVTADGATYMFAQNVLGHVVLLETLLAEDRLGEVAVFAGSEAARGLPKMGFKRPSFVSKSADELAAVIDGSFFAGRKPDVNLAYGQAKLLGILWMASLARQYPDRNSSPLSPGNTTGTHAPDDLALPFRMAAKYVMPHLGISHKLDVGAKRLVDGVTDSTLSSGVFYASAAGEMKGPLVNRQPNRHLPRSG